MSEDEELAQVRSIAESVLARAREDEGYLTSLREDPVAALQAAGLDEAAARSIGLDEWKYGDEEVEGFAICKHTCDRYSCKLTVCGYVPFTG
jgi:hypothetical protein